MRRKSVSALAMVLFLTAGAWAATETVLWNFGGKGDGAAPYGNSLIADRKGNLYGVTAGGGSNNGGVVFELSPDGHGGYTETVLYSFCSLSTCSDGYYPYGGLVQDKKGNLYGTTFLGAGCRNYSGFCGAVYELSPNGAGGWNETILYGFCQGGGLCLDGVFPVAGLTLDKQGNLYGTTSQGGTYNDLPSYFGPCDDIGCGTVFEMSPAAGGGWTHTVLYRFTGYGDGKGPYGGVVFDSAGNLYGTTSIGGGSAAGSVYELSPNGDGTWSETTLHNFGGGKDGISPEYVTLSRAPAGNLYGTTAYGGANNTGTIWQLSYSKADNSYKEKVLYSFPASGGTPLAGVIRDNAAAVLYGTTDSGGTNGRGTFFQLKRSPKGWGETVLQTFSGSGDGGNPSGALLRDKNGNFFGMTASGGTHKQGVVFEITP